MMNFVLKQGAADWYVGAIVKLQPTVRAPRNDDFLLKNDDFLLKNDDFLLKTGKEWR